MNINIKVSRICGYLRGLHPIKTEARVSDDTGIASETVAQWLKNDRWPSIIHLFTLIGAYGPDFLAAMYPNSRIWISPAQRLEELRQLQRLKLLRVQKTRGGQTAILLGIAIGLAMLLAIMLARRYL
jgi:transcriptional regulator with XRE-family HTH domain